MKLHDALIQQALDHSDHPAQAVGALMRASATILERTFGAAEARRLMCQIVGEAACAAELPQQSTARH